MYSIAENKERCDNTFQIIASFTPLITLLCIPKSFIVNLSIAK